MGTSVAIGKERLPRGAPYLLGTCPSNGLPIRSSRRRRSRLPASAFAACVGSLRRPSLEFLLPTLPSLGEPSPPRFVSQAACCERPWRHPPCPAGNRPACET